MTYPREDEPKKDARKKLSYQEAKLKAASFCAYQERYQQEVRNKLYSYGLSSSQVEELLSYLISEGYVNEERFAKAYAGGKFRMKKWGKVKIENELSRRNISKYCIGKALEEIENEEYIDVINILIEQKTRATDEENPLRQKKQIADFLTRKGFESVLIWDILNNKSTI